MDVTVNSDKKDKYYPRVVGAVARILGRSDIVAPVDVLVEMGNLSQKNLEAWRAGHVPYLERVFEGSLSKANRILRIIGFHVHDLDMVPSRATYRATSGRQRPLRFSKSGAKPIEDAYSRHYKWNKSAGEKPSPVDKNERRGNFPRRSGRTLTEERRLSVLSAPAGCCKPAQRPEC